MVLSVIIVNYRVRYFLELCLYSVQKAVAGIAPAEIIVIDNHSGDGSIEALRPLFPGVRFVENRENVGFAKANNLGVALASGEYVLFLNPDTVLPEDFGRVGLDFLRDQAQANQAPLKQPRPGQAEPNRAQAGLGGRGIGGVGVRMIDGSGQFLPESRRGFPSPWVAFSRLSGLSALFPRSRFFAGYYLGHLPADRTHPAPVLSGACLLVRRAILDEVGGFDERFFMYAEDIDLSYRIERAGYTNYYLADTTIIHFKGESTQKDIRYIRQFYKAMSQFRRKHFDRGLPALWNLGMEAAIWVRTGIGTAGRAFKRRPGTQHTPLVEDPCIRPGAIPPAGVEPTSCIRVTGDPVEAERVKKAMGSSLALRASERSEDPLVTDAGSAGAAGSATLVIFCEGPAFSFRECITALEQGGFDRQKRRALFHAAGSRSAVGSADREGRGETRLF